MGGRAEILTRRRSLALLAAASGGPPATAVAASPALERTIWLHRPGIQPQLVELGRGGSGVEIGGLRIRRLRAEQAALEVIAVAGPSVFNLEWRYAAPAGSRFFSWRREETERVALAQDTGEPGKRGTPSQLVPFAGALLPNGELHGAVGDSPGYWENRSLQVLDPDARSFSLLTGDSSAERLVTAIWGDSSSFYRGRLDGWQHLARRGEARRFEVWEFAAEGTGADLYAVRLAAHEALARGKGWAGSALRAILKNNAYLHVRRNLLREASSRYIVISGVTYGWKQWASDAAMTGLGLGDLAVLAEAMRGLFWERLNYEDNAQWYLIASAIGARSGIRPDLALARRALDFIRAHERNGAYEPPRLDVATAGLGWRTYMDLFYYEDGDAPTSSQGFHCGALEAARELGLLSRRQGEGAFASASTAFAAMFNQQGGYFPTSMRRQEVFGGDSMYGAAVTFAGFGRKCLPDELVRRHVEHARRIQSRYGLRVVSKAGGELLEKDQYGPGNPHGLEPEKAGAYVQGGSWFFCDAGTWLAGLAAGMDASLIDGLLEERIKIEIARAPAFSESVNTRTGEPHGNLLYGANALYLWLRAEIRRRLGLAGRGLPDPVETAVDRWLASRAPVRVRML